MTGIRLRKIGDYKFQTFQNLDMSFFTPGNAFSPNTFNKIKVTDHENIYFRTTSKYDTIVERCLGAHGPAIRRRRGCGGGGGVRWPRIGDRGVLQRDCEALKF